MLPLPYAFLIIALASAVGALTAVIICLAGLLERYRPRTQETQRLPTPKTVNESSPHHV